MINGARATTILIVVGVQIATGHSVPTHKLITTRAFEYLRSRAAGQFGCANNTLETQLQVGTVEEDADFLSEAPLGRFLFHFSPALNSGTLVQTTCSSSNWAFGGLNQAGTGTLCAASVPPKVVHGRNTHRWQDAMRNASDPVTGQPGFAGWFDLGYILHLLEDLTSPAHTRNDPHPHKSWKNRNFGDPDPIEVVTRDPSQPSADLVAFSTAEEFFSDLQTWTQSRFFSSDTVFDPEQPGPSALSQDANYYYEGPNLTGRRLAYKGWRFYLSLRPTLEPRRDATINDVIADEQFAELGPKAVQYVASLVRHYQLKSLAQIPGCATVPNQVPTAGFSMTSQGKGAVHGGILNLTVSVGSTAPVSFDGSFPTYSKDDGTISRWLWKEGTTVIGTTPTFIADFPVGTHDVSLVVTDNRDASSAPASGKILVAANQPPTAGFLMSAQGKSATQAGTLNLAVAPQGVQIVDFTALPPWSTDTDGTIVAYEWKSNGVRIPSATFTGGTMQFGLGVGTHTIGLVVKDNTGDVSNAATGTISVSEVGTPAQPIQWAGAAGNGHYYGLTTTIGTWTQVNAEALSRGGYLASINSAAEQQFIFSNFGGLERYIGFTDQGQEGTFRWTSGEPFTFTNWFPGEPNGGTAENVGQLRPDGLWNDHPGTLPFRGIIEFNFNPQGPPISTGNAVLDFSLSANPNGSWSYGFTSTLGGPLVLYTDRQPNLLPRVDRWTSIALDAFLGVARNSAATPVIGSPPTFAYPPDMLHMHPSALGQYDVVRWTAPSSGTFTFQGKFAGLDNVISVASSDVHIRLNGSTSLFSGNLEGLGTEQAFFFARQLTGGDTVDFVVGMGTNGNHNNDSTGLKVTILPGAVGTMNLARHTHEASLLQNGAVLITGGELPTLSKTATAELYDPQSHTFRYTKSPMNVARSGHTATRLPDGKVLIVGGGSNGSTVPHASVEIFDPVTETFTLANPLSAPRAGHRAFALTDGRVLVVGGSNVSLEFYNPALGTWSSATPMPFGSAREAITLLPDEKVFVAGNNTGPSALYDPATNTWRTLAPLLFPRFDHTATSLPNGKILITGGHSDAVSLPSEVYDIAAGVNGQSTDAGATAVGGWRSAATLLSNGTVLATGGYTYPYFPNGCCSLSVDAAHIFNPISGAWTTMQPMSRRRGLHTMTPLQSGKVLIVGGFEYDYSVARDGRYGMSILSSAELY